MKCAILMTVAQAALVSQEPVMTQIQQHGGNHTHHHPHHNHTHSDSSESEDEGDLAQ